MCGGFLVNDIEPQLFIDGRFRPAGSVAPVIEAATEELLGNGPNATHGDIDDAVAASKRALHDWRTTPPAGRAEVLERLADAMEARSEYTNELCSRETGTPIAYSRIANSVLPVAVLRYYAALICRVDV